MQMPDNPSNNDIKDALIELNHKLDHLDSELNQKIDRIDYKFDMYQKGTDGMVRMATTIFVATASVIVFSSLSPALAAIVTAFTR